MTKLTDEISVNMLIAGIMIVAAVVGGLAGGLIYLVINMF